MCCSRLACLISLTRLAPQDPRNRDNRVPAPCRRRHAVEFVDLAKIANRFHVATIHPEHELAIGCDHPHQPLPVWRKADRKRRPDTAGLRQDAHKSNDIGGRRLGPKRILRFQPHEIAAIAQHNFRGEWQLPEQCGAEFCSGSRFTNDKRARSSHIDDIKGAHLPCEEARPERPVSADIDASEENHERHQNAAR